MLLHSFYLAVERGVLAIDLIGIQYRTLHYRCRLSNRVVMSGKGDGTA